MIISKFPPGYKEDLDRKVNEQISIENQKCSEKQTQIYNSKKRTAPESNNYTMGFGVIGLIGGFFPCLWVGSQNNTGILSMLFSGLATWAICIAIGAGIGYAVYSSRQSSYESNNNDIDALKSAERISSEQKIKQIRANAEREYKEYCRQFEAQAQSDSVKFAGSELAEKVINWMTLGFKKTIESADRRAHIEKIEIPFIFNVYSNKITCNLGEFDFEVERCRNLTTPLEQTALARAIATAIQLNITMEYPKDLSGSEIVIDIHNEYYPNYVSTKIVYKAPNGNYEAVKSW
ncbi:MAG: hypothetical protein ACLU5E_01665 [Anaerovoracaceae bacterium]